MNNVTAVTHLSKMGGTHSLDLCQLDLSMWEWCLQQDIYLMAEHLPGKENLVQGIKNNEGSLRLDAECGHLQPDSALNGPMRDRSVCFPPNTTTTKVLLLETGSKSREYRCIQSGLVYHMGVCQPPIMSDSQIPE